jgi:hypothetical protein
MTVAGSIPYQEQLEGSVLGASAPGEVAVAAVAVPAKNKLSVAAERGIATRREKGMIGSRCAERRL